ncbi:MAG: ABC transporter ATP-binding protein [Thermomonas sp.]|uniref:ABC transporter ATP-binding protein n=1 Tax=Thermomonas sp. TaxID=1971895 RepID=UPI002602CE7C|nr:ABC transporter ATP-binding protein [Thermomonas sp.]MCC7097051.1 ABC transporter ATP-binding protein [Thermomonas sp.]
MPLAIETQGLTRRFGERIAVDAVDLRVPERSVYGFLGRNGAGKTTTIKLLLGLLRPDAGLARIVGIDVAKDRLAAARNVGALLEAQGFYPNLSGRENLDLCRRLLGLPASEPERVLDVVEMRAHALRKVADYSLGMRQRLGIARALLGNPPVLVLDEPTNGLDPEGIADMRRFLRDLPEQANATVLVSSHLLGEIEQVATHIGVLSHGKLMLQGALEDLKAGLGAALEIGTDAPTQAAAVLHAQGFEATQHAAGLVVRLAANAQEQDAAAHINRMLCEAGVRVHALVPQRRSLETLYHQAAQSAALS